MQCLRPSWSDGTGRTLPVLAVLWRPVRRSHDVIDTDDAYRLAADLLVAHAERDARGVAAMTLVREHLAEDERQRYNAMLQLAVQQIAADAINELAEIFHCSPREVIERLGS
jgi:hypothetical protein